jgi:protein TonB
MELLELFYVALGTIGILIALHLGTFAIARIMTPAKPKIVYVQAPQVPQAPVAHQAAPAPAPPPPPPPPPVLSQAPPTIQLPTYDTPPDISRGVEAAPQAAPRGLPPPIETRNATKQSAGDMGPPR